MEIAKYLELLDWILAKCDWWRPFLKKARIAAFLQKYHDKYSAKAPKFTLKYNICKVVATNEIHFWRKKSCYENILQEGTVRMVIFRCFFIQGGPERTVEQSIHCRFCSDVCSNATVNGNLDPTLSRDRAIYFGIIIDIESSPTKNRGWMNLYLIYLWAAFLMDCHLSVSMPESLPRVSRLRLYKLMCESSPKMTVDRG